MTGKWEVVEDIQLWTDYVMIYWIGNHIVILAKGSIGSDQRVQQIVEAARSYLHAAQVKSGRVGVGLC